MSKNNLTAKPHIFTFYHIFSKGFFLLTLPFLQQIFLHPESIWQKVSYTIFNIAFLASLIVIICFEYRQISYVQTNKRIALGKGLFHHTLTLLPTHEVTAISINRNIILCLARCCRIYISSNSCCRSRKTELFVTNSSAKKIVEFSTDKATKQIIYKSKIIYPLIMSLTQSNFLAGSFALSVIFKRLGDILGDELANSFKESISIVWYILAQGLPPAFSYIGGFIFAGFLFGLITQIFNNINFTSFCNDDFLFVYKGVWRKNILAVRKSFLNGVLIKQTLLMCIVKIYTVSLLYIGIKDDKNSGVYAPVAKKQKLKELISPVIATSDINTRLKPEPEALKNYMYTPAIYLLITIILCFILHRNFYISFVVRFIAVVLTPSGVLWLWFRVIAYKHCGVSVSDKNIVLCYFKHLNLLTAIVNHSAITKAVIVQNPFQRLANRCHIIFYIRDKKKLKIKIKHLDYNKASKIINLVRSL